MRAPVVCVVATVIIPCFVGETQIDVVEAFIRTCLHAVGDAVVGTAVIHADDGTTISTIASYYNEFAIEQTVVDVVVGAVALANDAAGVVPVAFDGGRDLAVLDGVASARTGIAISHQS